MRLSNHLPLLLALCLPATALAQTRASSTVTDVTVFPSGAEVTRQVTVDLVAGENDVVIADLPVGLVAEALRITAPTGVTVGASTLQPEVPVALAAEASPERQAAKTDLDAAKGALTAASGAVELVQADIAAADARLAFAKSIRLSEPGTTAAMIREASAAIGDEVAAAAQAAATARAALPPLEAAQAEAALAVTRAETVLAALPPAPESYAVLSVVLQAEAAGKVDLVIRHFVGEAGWTPIHDWYLTTGDVPTLRLDRAASVQQYSGEDWSDVTLTLSTAQPGRAVSPGRLWPELRQVGDPEKESGFAASAMEERAMGGMNEPVMEAEMAVQSAVTNFQGDIVTYVYPGAVSIAAGTENLRLALDSKDLTPRLFAQAVPGQNETAFAMVDFTNDMGEVILPAQGFLYRDGNFMGVEWHDQIAAGAQTDLAFGAIDQIRLSQDMPLRNEGERGIIASSTEQTEVRLMKVENLSSRVWDLRLLASVPYSEQEELVVEWQADLAPTEVDVDGQRGILAWDFQLAPGQRQELQLTHKLTWPDGKILQ